MLRTLGALALDGGANVQRRALLLLAYLAIEGRQERRRIAALFWPGATDPANRLSSALTRIRRARPDLVQADPTHVGTSVDHDVAHLARAVREGRFADALALYRGPFLSGVPPEPGIELDEWIVATREHAAAWARRAHLGVADALAAEGRFEAAAAAAEAALAVAAAPELDDEGLAHLLLHLKAGGSPRLRSLVDEALDFDVHVPASVEAARAELRGRVGAPRRAPGRHLPEAPTPFVGRERELERLGELLADPTCRLITILGPGGMGKTRLALRAAGQHLDAFPDGVHFVPFAAAAPDDPWAYPIADAVSLAFEGGEDPAAQLLAHLAGRRMLLLLDNLEHVLPGVGLLPDLLERAPGVRVLATSRERLGLRGEWTLDLEGLTVPDDATGDPARGGAVALFLQVARRRGRAIAPAELPDVVALCARVGGMPLALELASGWLSVLSPAEILREVSRGLDLLASDERDVPERQRDLRATFDLSWARLAPAERDVFAALGVVRGGCSLDAARAVAGADLATLRRLVATSFVVARDGRYGVHELLRQYAELQLAAQGRTAAVEDAHGRHFLGRLAELEAALKGDRPREALDAIDADWGNVRIAWRRALRGPATRLLDGALESLHLYADARSRARQVAELFDDALAALADEPATERVQGRLRTRRAFLRLAHEGDQGDAAFGDLDAALAAARAHGDVAEAALATWARGTLLLARGADAEVADACFDEARRGFAAANDTFYEARVVNSLALLRFNTRPLPEYVALLQHALALATERRNPIERALYLINLSDATIVQGAYDETEAMLRAALEIGADLRLHLVHAYAAAMLGFVVVLRGDVGAARSLADRAAGVLREVGRSRPFPVLRSLEAVLASFRGDAVAALDLAGRGLRSEWDQADAIDLIARWGRALAYAEVGDGASARASIQGMARDAERFGPAAGTWTLPIAAVLCAAEGDHERATELLALAQTHPASPVGWQRAWAPAAGLRSTLEAALGAAAFRRAWRRGADADATAALRALALTR
jgi:predicted ATPase